MPTYFVTGITGHQGSSVARHLLAQSHTVRAIVRDLDSKASKSLLARGAELTLGTYFDIPVLKENLSGTNGIFLNPYLNPHDLEEQARLTRTILDTARSVGSIRHIVVCTAFVTARLDELTAKADTCDFPMKDYLTRKAEVEAIVRAEAFTTGLTYTILRPSWLFFDYLAPQNQIHYPELYTQHELRHCYDASARMPHFCEDDVGKFAAAAFADRGRFGGAEIELTNESFTITEVAEIMSEVCGFKITAVRRSEEEALSMTGAVPTQGFHDLANWVDITNPKGHLEEWKIELTELRDYLKVNMQILPSSKS